MSSNNMKLIINMIMIKCTHLFQQ